jgi:UDP-N-acetylmuramoylalanine--D-glutamate ligase
MTSFQGSRVLVVGLGVSGFAAARALLSLDAKVKVTERGAGPEIAERADGLRALGAEVEIGGHDLENLHADLAVVSPGIPPRSAVIRGLRESGIDIWSEVELAYRLARCDFLAITGTNGKTTTTSLLAAMLEQGGVPSAAAGNIGLPLIDAIAAIPGGGAIALEVSSFQLATIDRFRPKVAVLLNVAEDHTDWHGSIDEYARAKARITENQQSDDIFLPNVDDEWAMRVAGTTRAKVVPFSGRERPAGGIGPQDGRLVWDGGEIIETSAVPLPGGPGLEDAAAAAGAALAYGVDTRSVARAIRGFRPLAHRLEVVAEVDGVTYIDDSKATNPHATLAAVRDLTDVVLIAGGDSKGMDLSSLASTVPPVRAVVALGEAADEVQSVFEGFVPVDRAATMIEATRLARARSVRGGSVLLSPGCASLDMYESYAARGEDFVRSVRALIDEYWQGEGD